MAARKSVWALDFDGVVCDSVGESSLSAWQVSQSRQCMRIASSASGHAVLTRELQASSDLWPDLFAKPAILKQRADVLSKMRVVRPVVETG